MSARSRCEMQSNGGFQVEVVGTGSIFVGRVSSEDNEKGGSPPIKLIGRFGIWRA